VKVIAFLLLSYSPPNMYI